MRDGPRGFRQDFSCPVVLRIPHRDQDISFTGFSPSVIWLPNQFNYILIFLLLMYGPTTLVRRLVWAFSVSLATTKEIDFFLSFPPVNKMFQFTGLLSYYYEFIIGYLGINLDEFPHSEISGSKYTYYSPKHIAVCRVLHQLLVPRHPPCALSNLITI